MGLTCDLQRSQNLLPTTGQSIHKIVTIASESAYPFWQPTARARNIIISSECLRGGNEFLEGKSFKDASRDFVLDHQNR